jgi:hypothetical protein
LILTESEQKSEFPAVSFTTFVLSLSTAALQNLEGDKGGDQKGQTSTSLGLAQQTIDILAMLEQKTNGNLSKEEEKLLKNILYDLRMRYIEAVRKNS